MSLPGDPGEHEPVEIFVALPSQARDGYTWQYRGPDGIWLDLDNDELDDDTTVGEMQTRWGALRLVPKGTPGHLENPT